ncbi:MAG: hypothetical protein ACLFS4_02505 [Opitutales bacterium]
MKWIWISGWAVPPERIKTLVAERWPEHVHVVVYPGMRWHEHVPRDGDAYFGHSMGAFLMLRERGLFPLQAPRFLLAPFCAFPEEAGQGGRVRRAQLKRLLRWMKEAPLEAVRDFYKRADLPYSGATRLPYGKEDLRWGVEQLLESVADPAEAACVRAAWVGDKDSLLDASKLAGTAPGLQVINGPGHALEELLPHVEDQDAI